MSTKSLYPYLSIFYDFLSFLGLSNLFFQNIGDPSHFKKIFLEFLSSIILYYKLPPMSIPRIIFFFRIVIIFV